MLVPKNEKNIQHFQPMYIDRKDPKEIIRFNRIFKKIKLTFHVQLIFPFVRRVPFGVCTAVPGTT